MMQQKITNTLQYHAARLSEVADMRPEAAPALLDAVDLIDTCTALLGEPNSAVNLRSLIALLRSVVEHIDSAPVRPSRILRPVVDAAGDIEAMAATLAYAGERVDR